MENSKSFPRLRSDRLFHNPDDGSHIFSQLNEPSPRNTTFTLLPLTSEREIAWRCGDWLSLREILGVGLNGSVPDHSTVSRTRRLIEVETHGEVFWSMLAHLAENELIDGKTIGIDATKLEANAAMRLIAPRETDTTSF